MQQPGLWPQSGSVKTVGLIQEHLTTQNSARTQGPENREIVLNWHAAALAEADDAV
jgi:hypothetical protein